MVDGLPDGVLLRDWRSLVGWFRSDSFVKFGLYFLAILMLLFVVVCFLFLFVFFVVGGAILFFRFGVSVLLSVIFSGLWLILLLYVFSQFRGWFS